jgi:hypothetical protein
MFLDSVVHILSEDLTLQINGLIMLISLGLNLTCLGLLFLAGAFSVTIRLSRSKSIGFNLDASIGLNAVSFNN